MMFRFQLFVIPFFVLQIVASQNNSTSNLIEDIIIKNGKSLLKNKDINSVSIGVLKNGDSYIEHFGEVIKGTGIPPSNESIYEIASVTKTMTGYLVAKAVLEDKLKLDNDVRFYLKDTYDNLEYQGQPITIRDLLVHTSGLPLFLPFEMNGLFESLKNTVPQTYFELEKNYNKQLFLSDLKKVKLTIEPGTKYSYSNAGSELIGHVLETVYNLPIDELFKRNLLGENGMLNTGIHLPENQQLKVIQGYWMNNKELSPNQLNTLWATGSGMKMTVLDMIAYMSLQLKTDNPVVSESHRVLFEGEKLLKVAYYWRVWNDKYGTSYNHHGGTGGMQNWLFIFPKYNMGICVLTNHSGPKTPNLLSKTVKRLLKDILKAETN